MRQSGKRREKSEDCKRAENDRATPHTIRENPVAKRRGSVRDHVRGHGEPYHLCRSMQNGRQLGNEGRYHIGLEEDQKCRRRKNANQMLVLPPRYTLHGPCNAHITCTIRPEQLPLDHLLVAAAQGIQIATLPGAAPLVTVTSQPHSGSGHR